MSELLYAPQTRIAVPQGFPLAYPNGLVHPRSVLHYDFQDRGEVFADKSKYRNHGNNYGSTINNDKQPYGISRYFVTNDYIEVPDHDSLSFCRPTGNPAPNDYADMPFSILAWVYMVDATNFQIAWKGVYNVDGEWGFYTAADDTLYFTLMDLIVLNTYTFGRYTVALTAYQNQWINIAGTYDGSGLNTGIKIYLNSVKVNNAVGGGGAYIAMRNLNHDVWIGRISATYANGNIRHVSLYRGIALSEQWLKTYYKNTAWQMGVAA